MKHKTFDRFMQLVALGCWESLVAYFPTVSFNSIGQWKAGVEGVSWKGERGNESRGVFITKTV